MSLAHYGISGGAVNIVAAFCTALIAVVAGFALVFLADIVFKVDFRTITVTEPAVQLFLSASPERRDIPRPMTPHTAARMAA